MADEFDALAQGFVQDNDSGFEDFLQSAFSAATTELVGGKPSPDVAQFRAESPIAGTVSNIAGQALYFVAPELLPLRALAGVPAVGRAAKYAMRTKATAPFLSEASAQVARFSLPEASRISLAAALHGADAAQETAGEAVFNMGAAAVIGGGLRKFRSAAPGRGPIEAAAASDNVVKRSRRAEEELRGIVPGYDLNQPLQARLRYALRAREDNLLPQSFLQERGTFDDLVTGLKIQIARESPAQGTRAIRGGLKLGQGTSPRARTQAMNRFFKFTRPGAKIHVRPLTRSKAGFQSREQFQAVQEATGLPRNWEQGMQFPRHLSPAGKKESENIMKTLDRNMVRVNGSGDELPVWINQEESGLYVVAKKITGSAKEADELDSFFIAKTDEPGLVAPGFEVEANSRINTELFRLSKALDELTPTQRAARDKVPAAKLGERLVRETADLEMVAQPERASGIVEAFARRVLPDDAARQLSYDLKQNFRFVQQRSAKYLKPTMMEVQHSPRAMRMVGIARAVHDRLAAEAGELLFGKAIPKSVDESIFKEVIRGVGRESAFQNAVRDISREGLEDFHKAMLNMMDSAQMREAGMRNDAIRLWHTLNDMDVLQSTMVKNAEAYAGIDNFTPLRNHLMLSRTFEGEKRLPLFNKHKRGQMVFLASGNSSQETIALAKAAQKQLQKEGIEANFTNKDMFASTPAEDVELIRKNFAVQEAMDRQVSLTKLLRAPKTFKERTGIPGSDLERSTLTKAELQRRISGHVNQNFKYAGNVITNKLLKKELSELALESPETALQVKSRLEAMAGIKSQLNKKIEDTISQTTGLNAQKITRVANETMFHLSLGFFDTGFAALNLTTGIQTNLAELSLLMTAPKSRWAHLYQPAFLKSSDGMIQEARFLDPIRVMADGWRLMAKPDAKFRKLYDMASAQGVTVPRFAEEVLGSKSRLGETMKGAFKGDIGIWEAFREVSAWLPTKSEELARAHSFATAVSFFRQTYGITDETQLLQLGARFVDRTMYRYATEDRARVTTGAVGGFFGLFKNWMLHYTSNLATYAGEGTFRGNWQPLLWGQAGTFSIAGAAGLTGFGAIDSMNRALADEPLMESLYNWWGYGPDVEDTLGNDVRIGAADFIYYGLPGLLPAAAQFTFQGRAAVPGSDVARDVSQLFSSIHFDRMMAAGDFLGNSIQAMRSTGVHPARDTDAWNSFIRMAAPRTLQRLLQLKENNAIHSLNTGNQLIGGMDNYKAMMHVLGITPIEVQKAYEIAGQQFEDQKRKRENITSFGTAIAEARLAGDQRAINNLYRTGLLQGLEADAMLRSADAVQNKRQTPLIDREINRVLSQAAQRNVGLLDGRGSE